MILGEKREWNRVGLGLQMFGRFNACCCSTNQALVLSQHWPTCSQFFFSFFHTHDSLKLKNKNKIKYIYLTNVHRMHSAENKIYTISFDYYL